MTILEGIKNRRSIRNFEDTALPEAAVDALIEAIRWAPSAGNLQSRKFFFVFHKEMKQALARAALNQQFIAQAPLVAVACLDRRIAGRYGDRGVNLYAIQDAAASVMSMMLEAHELGLGTVWVGAFNEFAVIEALDLPQEFRPVAIVPIGYPASVPKPLPRLSPEDAVTFVR